MKKFFGFGSSTPPPPPPPSRPPAPPAAKAPPRHMPTPAAAPSIVGQWKEPKGSDMTEFRGDGTVVEKPASGETIRGRYSLEGAKLRIKLDGLEHDLSFSVVVEANELAMTDTDGQVTHYRRA